MPMTKKKIIGSLLALMMLAIFSVGLSSCGDDNDNGGGNNRLIQTLKSNKWISRDSSYGEGTNNHAWVDIETWFLYFTSDNSGISYWIQKDYDTDLGNSTRTEYTLFTYSVSGNTVTITDEINNVSKYNYQDGYLVSESGGTILESSPMTSNDYDLVRSLGPKTGTCGSNLKYTYDERTRILTISGSGRMKDYNSSNQPWHDFGITEIVIEEGCTYIGTHAFHKLKYVVSDLDLPNSLQEIGDYAFCDLLISDLMVPTGLVRIGNYAFSDCKYLKKVNFASCDVLEEIGDFAFGFCPINQNYFTVPQNVKMIGSFCFFSSSFSNLTLNDKLESVGDQAFGKVTSSKLVIPNSVKSLGSLAFNGSFSEIRIGTGLGTIGGIPFVTSKSGKMYVNLSKPLALPSTAFQYIIGDTYGNNAAGSWTLYVPKGSKTAYQNAIGWKTFKSIIEDASLTSGNGSGNDNQGSGSLTGSVQGHDYVDLGLSVKWATCNVGASNPENNGWYFQWGETTTSSIPDYYTSSQCWETYEFYDESTHTCESIGSNICGTKYDTAYKKWGNKWRMATVEEWEELINNCSWKYTTQNSVEGFLGTAKNGQSVFLPAAGRMEGIWSAEGGYYWTADVDPSKENNAQYVIFYNDSNRPQLKKWNRGSAMSVRAVTK